jgi:flagellar hook-associated protein 3 FlgL
MRMTFNGIQGSLDAVNHAAAQFASAQGQVASGKRVQRPSDDPTAMQRAILDQSEIGTLDAYSQASDTAMSRLTVIDTVLGSMVDKLTEATVTATGARGTTQDQTWRDGASATLASLRDALVGDLNTQFRGTSLFAGSEAQAVAYAKVSGVWTYQGDTAPVSADVGRDRAVKLAYDGHAIAQGGDATDLFTELDALVTAVQTGDNDAIGVGIDALGRAFQRTIQAQSGLGLDEKTTSDVQEQLVSLRLASMTRLKTDQDANMAEAITNMTQAQIAYQSALAAIGKTSKLSLLDYL